MVKDKGRGAEKLDRENGGVCDHGILSHIKIRVGTAAIFEGSLVFLGIDSTTKDTTNNYYVEGGGFKKETGNMWHLFPIPDTTRKKITIRPWF